MRQPMLRWRRFRHGAHQMKRASSSGCSAGEVDEAAPQDAREDLALLLPLSYGARLALLRVHVAVGARDIEVAAERELSPARVLSPTHASSASRKRILGFPK
jgi:hypothetical protein